MQFPPETTMIVGEPETLSYDELRRAFGRLIHNEEWERARFQKPPRKGGPWLEDHVPFHDAFIRPWMIDLADDHYELDITRARVARLGTETLVTQNAAEVDRGAQKRSREILSREQIGRCPARS